MSHFGKYTTLKRKDFLRTVENVKGGIKKCRDSRKKAIAIMALTTGLRIDEIVLQRWEYGWGDQSFDFIMVPEETVKGKKRSRPICYSPALKLALRRVGAGPERKGFLFPGRTKWGRKSRKDGAITTRTAERWIKEVGLLGGIENLEAHDMRRIFSTLYMIKSEGAGGDLLGIQTMLGHQKLGTTAIYILDNLWAAMRIIASFFR